MLAHQFLADHRP